MTAVSSRKSHCRRDMRRSGRTSRRSWLALRVRYWSVVMLSSGERSTTRVCVSEKARSVAIVGTVRPSGASAPRSTSGV